METYTLNFVKKSNWIQNFRKPVIALAITIICSFPFTKSYALCGGGKLPVNISITTDNWGYECFWELVPTGSLCGDTNTTIFTGGNTLQIGCSGGCAKVASGGNGYASNTTITEGPFCLIIGQTYDIIYVDDYGDGGATFDVLGNTFTGTVCGDTFSFTANPPPPCSANFSYSTSNNDAFFSGSATGISPISWSWDFGDGSPVDISQNPSHTYALFGTYNVCLSIIDDSSCTSTWCDSVTVQVPPPCNAGFSYSIFSNNNASFNSSSSGTPPLSWSWDFGDGTGTFAGQNPSYTYGSSGTYNVCLSIIDANSCSNTWCDSVTVGSISFTVSTISPCPDSSVTFTNTSSIGVYYVWDYGDGLPYDTTYNTSHIFPDSSSSFIVFLYALDSSWSIIGNSNPTWINPVNAGFSYSTGSNNDALFNGFSSGPLLSWSWDFGDSTETSIDQYPYYIYGSSGTYNVCLTVTEVSGCSSTWCDSVTAGSISFTANTTDPCPGSTVTFTNTSTIGTNYIWYYGGGSPADTSFNGSHLFTSCCSFNVYMNAYDSSWNNLGSSNSTWIYPVQQYSQFYMSKNIACPGESIYFTLLGNAVGVDSLTWDFGDGNTSTEWWNNHTYASPDTFIVSLTIYNKCGNYTLYDTIVISDTLLPNANFSMSLLTACPNKQINFAPFFSEGISYLWDFGDGDSSSSQYPYHTYSSGGNFSVTLTVTNICGNNASFTNTIFIDTTIMPVNANFNISTNIPCPGTQIAFSSFNPIGAWNWDFGDGGTSTVKDPKYIYYTTGTFTVIHTITNLCGNQISDTSYITITDTIQPNPDFSYNPWQACPGEKINFNPFDNEATSYFWDFGDGAATSLKYSNHEFGGAGNYGVTLTVTNVCGNSQSKTDTITIVSSKPVTASYFDVSPYDACPTEKLWFNTEWGYPTYVWDFGDGNIDTSSNSYTEYQYDTSGVFNASVTLINYCGNDTTLYKTITINSNMAIPTLVSLDSWPDPVCPTQPVQFDAPWGFASYEWNMGDSTPVFTTQNGYMSYSYSTVGTYTVSVIVTNYCGNDTTLLRTLNVQNTGGFDFGLSLSASSPKCPNEEIDLWGPWGYPTYTWNFGDSSALLTTTNYYTKHIYSNAGLYIIALNVTNYCGDDTTIFTTVQIDSTLNVTGGLWLSLDPEQVCPNQEVNMYTSSGFTSYIWDFGDGYIAQGSQNVNHAYDSLGNYTVSVTVYNGCGNSNTISKILTVDTSASFPSWMNMWANPSPVCPGDIVTLITQSGYETYFWDFDDGDTITTFGGQIDHIFQTAGNYDALVTITNSCGNSITLNYTINVDNSTSISWLNVYLPNNPSCPGDQVQMNVQTMMGGGSTYIYAWDFADGTFDTTIGTSATHVYADTGIYNVTLTATNACGKSYTTTKLVTISNNGYPSLNPWVWGTVSGSSVVGCPGDAVVFYFLGINDNNVWDFGDSTTGVATEVIMTEDWSGNVSPVTIIKHVYSTIGNFMVTLTLTNNCGNSTSDIKQVTVADNLLVSGGITVEPPTGSSGYTTCQEIEFVAYGGENYDWNFGDGTTISTISPTISHVYINDGNYTVTVTITNGCLNSSTYSESITINGVSGTILNTSVVSSPICNGSSDGVATVSVAGGQPPYVYQWDDPAGQTSDTAINLSAGIYSVTVTDDNGCSGIANLTITDPLAISLSISTVPASCGLNDGEATVTVDTGGTAPYTYAWSNGNTSSIDTGLAVGSYTVAVTDSNGCSASGTASISESGGTVISVSSSTNVTCNGGTNGAIDISISAGTPPYIYAWSNGDSTEDLTNIPAGTYIITVSDSGGCSAVENITINEPSILSLTTSVEDANCGSFDGNASVSVSGGNPPYSYQWDSNTGFQTDDTAAGLPAGSYMVVITDSANCIDSAVANISNKNAPVITDILTDISCYGNTDGAIDITVTGGTSPYLYTWSNNTFLQDISDLIAGQYILFLTDASGCLTLMSYIINEPDILSLTISSSDETSCGNADGSATLTASGGTIPYSYIWSNGDSTETALALSSGAYGITVADANGCSASDSVIIDVTVPSQDICLVTVDSSATRYLVVWENSGSSAASFNIYRETAITDTFEVIGNVSSGSLSIFTDTASYPNTKSGIYKISALDSCGNESALSARHKTHHLTNNLGGGGEVNLIWDNYEGFSGVKYRIWRGTTIANMVIIDSVSGSIMTYTDTMPPAVDSINYQLELMHPTGCSPALAKTLTYNSAKSNVSNRIMPPSCQTPVAGFTFITSNLTVNFTNNSTTTGTSTWSWNFDDGTPVDNTQDPSHTYASDSTYNVCLTITDSCGNNTFCDNITVTDTTTGINLQSSIFNLQLKVYPNPYTGQTEITYTLTEKANVTLEVYNVLGKKVITLVNDIQNQGNYKYKFSGSENGNLSGIFILKLIVNDKVYTKQLVELR